MLPTYLLLLPHDLQLLSQLYLPLSLGLLGGLAQLFSVLLAQGVQGPAGVSDLSQLVLQTLIIHCREEGTWLQLSIYELSDLWQVIVQLLYSR